MSEVSTSLVAASSPIEGVPAESQEQQQPAAVVEPGKIELPKQDDKFAAKFAALTRKEKEIRDRERQYAAKEAEYAKKLQEIEERSKGNLSLEEQFKANPYKFIKERGYGLEQLTEMELLDGNPTPDMKLKQLEEKLNKTYEQKLAELEAKLADREKKEQEESMTKQEQAFMNELTSIVNADEKYELIRAKNSVNLVRDVMQQYFDENREAIEGGLMEMLSIADAANAVESHLEEEAKQIFELKKFKGLQIPKQEQKQSKTTPTLSNTLSSEVPKTGEKLLSKEDSIREAAKMIRWID